MSEQQAKSADLPTVSVVTAAFAMERWDNLREAVASVRVQTMRALEMIVVIDHNQPLLHRAKRELQGVIVLPNDGSKGASGARNAGVAASHGKWWHFLTTMSWPLPTWLASLLHHFADPDVVGVGGSMAPLWEADVRAGSRPSSTGLSAHRTWGCPRKPAASVMCGAAIW